MSHTLSLPHFLTESFHSYPDPLFIKDQNFRFLYVNGAFARFMGRNAEEFYGKDDFDFLSEKAAQICRANDARLLDPENAETARVWESEEKVEMPSGMRDLQIRRYLLRDGNQTPFIFGQIRDVTNEKRSHEFLHATEVAGKIGAFEFTQPTGDPHWSEGLYEILGLDPRTRASGDLFMSVVHEEDREHIGRLFQRATEERSSFLQLEYRIVRASDRAVRWIRSIGKFEYFSEGVRFVGTSQDLTDLRISEVRRRETERRFEDVLELIEEVVWSVEWNTWETIFMSSSVERFYGVPLSTIKNPQDWVRAYSDAEIARMLDTFLRAEKSRNDQFSGEFHFRHPTKGARVAFLRGRIVRDAVGKALRVEGLTSDITELRRAENELHEQRQKLLALGKLNTLGELASGIGHEINTPLSGILSKVARVAHALNSGLAGSPTDIEKSRRLLEEAMSLVERISQIVEGLKQLSSTASEQNYIESDPRLALEQALSLSRARFSNHGMRIEVEDRLPPDTTVVGKPTSLFQVLVNVLNNAFDAMEKRESGGRVRITLREEPARVIIRVCDNGSGISDEFRPHLFEAFQTTKAEGRGTGLGLNISRRLLRAEGGDLVLAEASGESVTCFEIILKQKPRPGNLPERGQV